MPFIAAVDAAHFALDQVEFFGLAAPSRGASENAVWRVRVAAGSISAGSHQLSREEILVATTGRAIARLDGERHVFAAGDAIVIPPFVDFALDNPHDEPFEAIAVLPVGGRAMLAGAAPFIPPWAI